MTIVTHFTVLSQTQDEVLGVRLQGRLEDEVFRDLAAEIESRVERHASCQMLLELKTVKNFTPDEFWKTLAGETSKLTEIESLAVVCEPSAAEDWMSSLVAAKLAGRARHFVPEDLRVAWEWVKARSGGESPKMYLKGELDGPSGQAPSAAWQSVEGRVERPEDLWVSGQPDSPDGEIFDRIRKRLEIPDGPFGFRLRFVTDGVLNKSRDLLSLVNAVLARVPELGGSLFLHAETMSGDEPGVYLAFENRPPALLTQFHFAGDLQSKHPDTTRLEEIPDELHLNLLLHDTSLSFVEALEGRLMESVLGLISSQGPQVARGRIQEISMARSDAHSAGISVGVERVGQQSGAQGGYSAAEWGSRAHSQGG